MVNEDLFDQFKALYRSESLDRLAPINRFIKDGITNTDLFVQQKTRVLFIAKEHNGKGKPKDEQSKDDYREWGNDGVYFRFAHRLSEWSYGILNNFPLYEQVTLEMKRQALKSIAFINVKKTSGNSSATPEHICQYISASKNLLQQQIISISPTLIVCCFRYDHYVELLFNNKEEDKLKLVRGDSKPYSTGKWNGINLINFYHPSSRKKKRELYKLLEEAYNQAKSDQA